MVTLSGIHKEFGGQVLFENVSLQINRQDRIGLVGKNGAGKTTLLSLIAQHEPPNAGHVASPRNLTLGFLPQETAPVGEETVLELASGITPTLADLQRERYAKSIPQPPEDNGSRPTSGPDPEARFAELGGYQTEAEAKKILIGLGFGEADFDRPCHQLSGGWRMRVHLARLLTQNPDLLLLDEPTNHLDLGTLLWFQDYLKRYSGALVIISHDREFLNQLAREIFEVRQRGVFRYTGNYDAYLEQREAEEAQQWAAYRNQEREKARLMAFVNRFRAKATKASQAQSKLKQIERMETVEPPGKETRNVHFSFPQAPRIGSKAIELRGVDHAYGEARVYSNLHFRAERGQRIVLIGPNGAGKSTLLKLLAGVLPLQSGERILGHNAKVGYYAQQRTELLDPDRTVLDEAMDTPRRLSEEYVRTVLGCFLFHEDDISKYVAMLSGGEKSRLALAKLLLDPPNLLLMDEPTTHLDIPSIEALLQALSQFHGTLIFISHDVYFIRSLANHVVHVNRGAITHYSGGYQYYLDKTGGLLGVQADQATASTPPRKHEPSRASGSSKKSREQKRAEAEERQKRSRQRREQQKRVEELEKQIENLETRQKELTNRLEQSQTYQSPSQAQEINRELQQIVEELRRLTNDWETEASKLTEVDAEA